MTIVVQNEWVKKYHAKKGYNNLFGRDVDERQKMTDEQLISLFDRVWKTSLCGAVTKAEKCSAENARQKLTSEQQAFFKETQEHREFQLEYGWFIAQLTEIENGKQELTQLWFIRSSNVDPRTLFVTFDSVELRDTFSQVASRLGYADGDLGKKILIDFMETILKTKNVK